jgi:hypothetical protein
LPTISASSTLIPTKGYSQRRRDLIDTKSNNKSNPILEAQAAGFDIQLLELNLSLTPAQRIEQHQSALSLVLDLENIRMARDENPQ